MEKRSKREKKIRKLEKKLQKLKDKEYQHEDRDVMELTVQKVTIPRLVDQRAKSDAEQGDTIQDTIQPSEVKAQDVKTMSEKSVYEKILEEARETEYKRPVYTTGYFRSIRMIFTAFFADPQATLSAQLTDPDHRAAWTFFMTGVMAFLAGGLLSGGIASGLQAAVLYTIYMMIYPFLVAILSGTGRNAGIRDILSVFWVSGIFIDCVHVFSVLSMLMGLWFLAIVAEILALPLGIVFNYMATSAIYGGDNKRAIRTTIIALVTFMLLMIAAGFLLIAISVINSALGQMMDGGFNIPALIEFILQYVK